MKLRFKTLSELKKICIEGEFAWYLKNRESEYHFPKTWRYMMGKWCDIYSNYIEDDEDVYEGDFPESPLPSWFFSPYKASLDLE